jgi:allantoinase
MIAHATKVLSDSCGQRPYGWMGPWISETLITPDLLQENGYKFIMDWPADDQPFWMATRAGRILSIPYPIEINDTPTMLSRAQPATDFRTMILDQFDEVVRLSEKQSLVFGISLHTFCTGQPFRLRQVRQALEILKSHVDFEKVWVTTPGKIAEFAAKLPAASIP